jgi:bifunctional aspartokinase / homoserine dehydrogenase 1
MKVMKFGGSSVGSPEIIAEVKKITASQSSPIVVVVSAFKGITDQIILASNIAASKSEEYQAEVEEMRERHLEVIDKLVPSEKKEKVRSHVNKMLNDFSELLFGVHILSDLTPKTLDHLLSYGERLSSFIISNILESAVCVDMRNFIRTDSQFGNAQVDFDLTDQLIRESLGNLSGIAIAPGFIAANQKGDITTLGRGGSDYTAAIIAAALDAESLEIWTDVDGFMTADPRQVSKAYPIASLSYSEAMELSHFGAKVIYTPTLFPAYKKNIPIVIKNTFNTEAKGTLISAQSGNGSISPIKGVSSIEHIDLITLLGSGLPGVTGTSMRLFSALAKKNISVILITQASSEYSISIAVAPSDTDKALKSIAKEFQIELEYKKIIDLKCERNLSIIAIVGEKMRNTPGISAILFTSLGRNGISVIATAQGSSELNISVVIKQESLRKALNVIHEGFFLSNYKELHLYIAGTGTVGRDLLAQIQNQRKILMHEHNLKINVAGIMNSRKMLVSEKSIDLQNYQSDLDKGEASSHAKFLEKIASNNLRNSVFVDCTASQEVSLLYKDLFNIYVSVVTANKIACSSEYSNYKDLKIQARTKGVKFIYETNVGAGLPIINTINDLIRSGDKILRLEAVLSGTLNFIFNTVSDSVSLSDAVKMAKEKGFSEPDPRIDLSGVDVMRKLIILSRESGYPLESKDISLNPFLPSSCFEGSLNDFWKELEKINIPFEEKRKSLANNGKRWRFVAILNEGKASIELKEIDNTHPAFELADSNNIILIRTERYKEQPMVIRGYGAGAAVTAAGMFADVIRIANV